MADEAFEALWAMKAGPELVALHGLFGGAMVSMEEIRGLLDLSPEELRAAVLAAQRMGFIEPQGDKLLFPAFAPGSAQQGRLEWCLESHQEDLEALIRRLRTRTLVRYLAAPSAARG